MNINLVFVASVASSMDSFKSGQPWLDTDGNVIDAHGAGIMEHEGTYYWSERDYIFFLKSIFVFSFYKL